MIIYSSTAMDFKQTVDSNKIASEIERAYIEQETQRLGNSIVEQFYAIYGEDRSVIRYR